MRNEFIQKIYYADTDAYGVVWHGAYLRWLEKGRCDFSEELGFGGISETRYCFTCS